MARAGIVDATVEMTDPLGGVVKFKLGSGQIVDWQSSPRRLAGRVCKALPHRVRLTDDGAVRAWAPVAPRDRAELTRFLKYCGVRSPATIVKKLSTPAGKVTKQDRTALDLDAAGHFEALGAGDEVVERVGRWLPAGLAPLAARMLEVDASAKEIEVASSHLASIGVPPIDWIKWLEENAFELIDKDVDFRIADALVDADEALRAYGAARAVLHRVERNGSVGCRLGSLAARASELSGIDRDAVRGHVWVERDGSRWVEGKYSRRFYRIQRLWTDEDGRLRSVKEPVKGTPRWIINEPTSSRERAAAEGIAEFALRRVPKALRCGELGKLDREQEAVLDAVRSQRLTVVTGPAGTGKSYVVGLIGKALTEAGYRVAWTATTGRAAQGLHSEGRTLHSYLGVIPGNQTSQNTSAADVLIVDEASMLDTALAAPLGHHVKTSGKVQRLILVGDPYQLPPVGPGKVLLDLCDTSVLGHAVVALQAVHRTKAKGILKLATAIRERGNLPELGGLSGVTVKAAQGRRAADRVVDVVAGTPPSTSVLVITPTREGPSGVYELNGRLRELHLGPSDDDWVKGQRVIQTRTEKITEDDEQRIIANGTFGTVLDVDDGSVLVRYEGGERPEVRWDLAQCSPTEGVIAGGYALTVHRAQGQQADRVVVVADPSGVSAERMWENPAMGYTAVTRAQRDLVIVGEPELLSGDPGSSPADRVSFLPERMAEYAMGPARGSR